MECSPCIGKIIGGERQKINLRVCPVMPSEFKEVVMVQVGYFEPEPITITGKGFYPAILSNMPRVDIPEFKNSFDTEFEKKKNEREQQLKRQQLMAKAQEQSGQGGVSSGGGGPNKSPSTATLAGIRSVEQIQTDIEKELDRSIFCTQIQRALEEREKEKLLTSTMQLQ